MHWQVMNFIPDEPVELSFLVVILCWVGFGAIVVSGKLRAARTDKKTDLTSHVGFLLQMVAYAICFLFPRVYFSPFIPMPRIAEWALAALVGGIAIASEWLCFSAARTLGKHWALVARVVEGHELVELGPYSIVRNPIYLAMLGMLVATGLAVSRWPVVPASLAIFLVGNQIRIHSEERLLRDTFGSKFDDYARRVPGIFPRIR